MGNSVHKSITIYFSSILISLFVYTAHLEMWDKKSYLILFTIKSKK